MEKGLRDFLKKRYGSFEKAEIYEDHGKWVRVGITIDEDEFYMVVINRRKGDNGNYRVVSER